MTDSWLTDRQARRAERDAIVADVLAISGDPDEAEILLLEAVAAWGPPQVKDTARRLLADAEIPAPTKAELIARSDDHTQRVKATMKPLLSVPVSGQLAGIVYPSYVKFGKLVDRVTRRSNKTPTSRVTWL